MQAITPLLPHLKVGVIWHPKVIGIPAVPSPSAPDGPGGIPPRPPSASPLQWTSSMGFGGTWTSGPLGLSPVSEPVLLMTANVHTSFQANACASRGAATANATSPATSVAT